MVDVQAPPLSARTHMHLNRLVRRHPHSRIAAQVVYNEYIQDRHHVHMNATKWVTEGPHEGHIEIAVVAGFWGMQQQQDNPNPPGGCCAGAAARS